MSRDKRLQVSLLAMRASVFLVMLMWTVDKFVNPEHAAAVYKHFYFISGLEEVAFYVIGVVELVMLVAFLGGIKKRITYGLVLVFHGVSTFSSYQKYATPFESVNLLFFAAWPMLAACLALYLLRDEDRMFTFGK